MTASISISVKGLYPLMPKIRSDDFSGINADHGSGKNTLSLRNWASIAWGIPRIAASTASSLKERYFIVLDIEEFLRA